MQNPYEAPQAELNNNVPSSSPPSANRLEYAAAILHLIMQVIMQYAGFPNREYFLMLAVIMAITGVVWAWIRKKYGMLVFELLLLTSALIALYIAPQFFILERSNVFPIL